MSRELAYKVNDMEWQTIDKAANNNESIIGNLNDTIMEGYFDHINDYDEMLKAYLAFIANH